MSKTLAIAFYFGADLSGGFKNSIGAAEKQLSRLGQEVNRIEEGRKDLNRFKNMRTSSCDTERQIAAGTEVARLERQIALTDKPSRQLLDGLKSCSPHTRG